MNRPTRRKSSLTGANPVAPAPPPEPEAATDQAATETRTVEPAQRASSGTSRATNRAGDQPPKKKYPPKVSFYQDPEDTARVRGAILHTMTTEGARSLSHFIDRAVMTEVERLETKYNAGKPFRSVAARELPQGRPMGE